MGLKEISPVDGRYENETKELRDVFSEYGLQKARLGVEVKYLLFLSKKKVCRNINPKERRFLLGVHKRFSEKEMEKLKGMEKKINHDVKAVEYYLRKKMEKNSLKELTPMVHFGLTSEDASNLAYSLMLGEGLKLYLEELGKVKKTLAGLARSNLSTPMLSHTHGQPSSPTTLGKEALVFGLRMREAEKRLDKFVFPGKMNSAVGNFNAQRVAVPGKNWPALSKEFVSSLGLRHVAVSTQIIPHEEISFALRQIVSINNVLVDLDRDFWMYVGMNYLTQKVKKGEVGSSIMPQKVNPIFFENSEGNLLFANAVLEFLASQLQVSRLQRDLTDSTIKRNYGLGFAHSLLGLKSVSKGLSRVSANKEKMLKDLEKHPEVLAEAIQTVLRKHGDKKAYEKVKKFFRGKEVSLENIHGFVKSLGLDKRTEKRLLGMRAKDYTGYAEETAKLCLKELNSKVK